LAYIQVIDSSTIRDIRKRANLVGAGRYEILPRPNYNGTLIYQQHIARIVPDAIASGSGEWLNNRVMLGCRIARSGAPLGAVI